MYPYKELLGWMTILKKDFAEISDTTDEYLHAAKKLSFKPETALMALSILSQDNSWATDNEVWKRDISSLSTTIAMSCRLAMFHNDDVKDIQQNLPDYIELNLFGMLENGGMAVQPVTVENISWRLCYISDELDAVARYAEENGLS